MRTCFPLFIYFFYVLFLFSTLVYLSIKLHCDTIQFVGNKQRIQCGNGIIYKCKTVCANIRKAVLNAKIQWIDNGLESETRCHIYADDFSRFNKTITFQCNE